MTSCGPQTGQFMTTSSLCLAWSCLLQTCHSGAVGTSSIFPEISYARAITFTGHRFHISYIIAGNSFARFPSVSSSDFPPIFQHLRPTLSILTCGPSGVPPRVFSAPPRCLLPSPRTVLCILVWLCATTLGLSTLHATTVV